MLDWRSTVLMSLDLVLLSFVILAQFVTAKSKVSHYNANLIGKSAYGIYVCAYHTQSVELQFNALCLQCLVLWTE